MPDPNPTYPEQLAIEPFTQAPQAISRVPGSKSITNRALVLAALADAPFGCRLSGALHCEDTDVMIDSLQRLGFEVRPDWNKREIFIVRPTPEGPLYSRIPRKRAELFVGNSGTSMRFLTALVSIGIGEYRIDGVQRMRERPIEDLLSALRQLDVTARSEEGTGCPPVLIRSHGLRGGSVQLKGDVSSQFLSALLLAAPYASSDVTITVEGELVSEPYVLLTERMMKDWRLLVNHPVPGTYHVSGMQKPAEVEHYNIEPDATTASYFWGAAAITGGEVTVEGVTTKSHQGDVRFVDLLEQMGCSVNRTQGNIAVRGGPLHGIDVDMNDISDTVMTLAAVACFAEGPTTIRNVAHIRHKETDRLTALVTELGRLGAEVQERPDGLTIVPRPLRGTAFETYNDHRMAMSLALIGLRVPGVIIKNPACVAKTYPHFFRDLDKLRFSSES